MVELQSSMNASALCGIEQEVVKGESSASHFAIAEILAELQRERQKNAELRDRISNLEAQIQDKDLLHSNGQVSCPNARERSFKKFKKQKVEEQSNKKIDDGNTPMASQTQCKPPRHLSLNCLVNWVSMDDTRVILEKLNDGNSTANCVDTDDTDDEDEENEENAQVATDLNELLEDADKGMIKSFMQSSSGGQGEETFPNMSQESCEDQTKIGLPDINPLDNTELKILDRKQMDSLGGYQVPLNNFISDQDFRGSGSILTQKKPQKMAFCPTEVKRIIELEELQLKNAQSHTIRKIIVFASLGIRHGCEDMYELDFNHFRILRKGEPFVSPDNPGEHVLYENPGIRRKVFYPNRQNPTLCPVEILEEERAMRPFDDGCRSCLFLCIKYGGRTRNLPQNEYVRQRMGRNKLKSFGPVICRMAMLVHTRSGSFFFKALGITLLFMAGFPDDLVQKETKYRNLELLQKYYRTDEDAKGEELFLSCPITCHNGASPNSEQLLGKTSFTKSKGKKYTSSVIKSQNSAEKTTILQSAPSSSTQFGLLGYTSIQTHAMIQTTPSRALADTLPISHPMVSGSNPKISYRNQSLYPMLPPYPSSSFVPMMYWPSPNAFPPCHYPSSYGYQPFPAAGSYMSIHSQPYYSHPQCNPMIPKLVEGTEKNDAASAETDSDSNSSSSSTAELKEE